MDTEMQIEMLKALRLHMKHRGFPSCEFAVKGKWATRRDASRLAPERGGTGPRLQLSLEPWLSLFN